MLNIPPNWGTFFALIVSFLVFWFIFKRLLFGPFLALLSAREQRMRELKDDAQRVLNDAKAAEERYRRELAQVHRASAAEREQARRVAEQELAGAVEQAREAARRTIEQAQAEVEGKLQLAYQHLEELSRALARELAEKLLGRRLGEPAHSPELRQ
jgi:F0F1-type ATP synthase membrane subunit b/b'